MGILRTFVNVFAAPKASPKQEEAPTTWREAPTNEVSVDVGYGVTANMSWSTGHHGFIQVVGESHYQETLRHLDTLFATIGRTERVFTAKLVPEPTNQFDSNAVAVCTEGDAKVGYLSRDVAKSYHKALAKQSAHITCPAKLVGGKSGSSHLGVILDFEQVRKLKT